MGKAIASVIGVEKMDDGFINCRDGSKVTWAFGHLYEQADPEDYNPVYKRWEFSTLPIIPEQWKLRIKRDKKGKEDAGVKKQLGVIKKLVKECKTVVNAGDPDREGQLLIDEILIEMGNKKPVERIWLASLDEKSVKKALAELKSNNLYDDLRQAAEARSKADWLSGMNLTRAMTLMARQSGNDGVFSIGRVQTPTCALVVDRDNLIDNFKPIPYYVPVIQVKHANGTFRAILQIDDNTPGIDDQNRIVDERAAQQIVRAALASPSGNIKSYTEAIKNVAPPMPYSLSLLQKEASSKLGLSAEGVLKAAQNLYESKLTTYPRTDCNFLPEEQFADAAGILQRLGQSGHQAAGGANSSLKSKAWNTSKVTAHHGIIPTGQSASNLAGNEKAIYEMIVNRYIEQFYPDYQYKSQQAVSLFAEYQWKSEGKSMVAQGWKAVAGGVASDDEPEENLGMLPVMQKGDGATCVSAEVENKKTTPPPRFTDGTLIEAMAAVHKFVSDPKIKARLKENSGIGTEATRANIIETLINRDYIKRKGKQLISTDRGKELIKLVPENLKDPGLTALWEDYLEQISSGKLGMDDFIRQQEQMLPKMINLIKNLDFKSPKNTHKCPTCGSALKKWQSKNKSFHYWSCLGDRNHPVFFDKEGKPGEELKRKGGGE